MYNFLFYAHSGWRWIVLVVILIVTLKMVIGWVANQNWSDLDTLLVRVTNYVLGIQILLGIVLYIMVLAQGRPNLGSFTGSHVVPALLSLGGAGFALARSRKAPESRQKFIFASIGMLVTILLIYGALATVGGIFA